MMKSDEVLAALRDNAEGGNDNGWSDVYLDNASAGLGMTPMQFRSCLSVLAQRGVYRVVDGYAWGKVALEDAE